MPALYLSDTDAVMGVEGDAFKISSRDGSRKTVPMLNVDSVVVFVGAQVTTQAVAELLERDIPTTFLSNHGRYYGRLVSTETKSVELRLLQYKHLENKEFRLNFSKAIIKGKILNCLYILKNVNRYRGFDEVKDCMTTMQGIVKRLEDATSLDSIRGYEGSASAAYFKVFPDILKENLGFTGRNRRPPKDPINSMLSFLYTLLMYNVYTATVTAGLDPAVGFLHEYTDNRPALPLDLMEEFRTLIADQVVIDMVNHGMVPKDGFYQGEETDNYPILIQNDLRKKIIARYEKRLATVINYEGESHSYRRVFELQARKLVRHIRGIEEYKPFIQQ